MNRKRIKINLLFILATLSLLATGFWIHPTELMPNIFLTSYFSICGTWVIYGLEVNHRENNSLLSLFKALNKRKGQQFFVLHLIFITPIFIYFSSWDSILIMLLIALIGVLYSIKLNFIKPGFRLKQMFLVKNILIGLAWGLLILLGGNILYNLEVMAFFFLVSLQIFIGSALRDVADIYYDKKINARTIPIILGLRYTFPFLHVLNSLSLLIILIYPQYWVLYATLFVVAWKALLIEKVKKEHQSILWTQTLNILTCPLILILVMLLKP